MIKELRLHPSAEFVDIGANIGAYSLAVAHILKRRVVSVEPSDLTYRRLSRSLCLGELGSLVTLVPRAISNDRRIVRLASVPGNLGTTVILNDTRCILTRNQIICTNESSQTIMLDDLTSKLKSKSAILKVDTEGSEIKIFTEQAASKFFNEVDVVMVYMEFMYYSRSVLYGSETAVLVEKMLKFFLRRGFDAYGPDGRSVLPLDWSKWPDDVIWKK